MLQRPLCGNQMYRTSLTTEVTATTTIMQHLTLFVTLPLDRSTCCFGGSLLILWMNIHQFVTIL